MGDMATEHAMSDDRLFVDKVMRARQMDPAKKFLLGAQLYEYARGIAMAAIRAEHPEATPEEQRKLFKRRQAIAKWIEENP